jgi:hypothetical protein
MVVQIVSWPLLHKVCCISSPSLYLCVTSPFSWFSTVVTSSYTFFNVEERCISAQRVCMCVCVCARARVSFVWFRLRAG